MNKNRKKVKIMLGYLKILYYILILYNNILASPRNIRLVGKWRPSQRFGWAFCCGH